MASHGNNGSPWPGPVVLELLEPADKAICVFRNVASQRRDRFRQRVNKSDLSAGDGSLLGDFVFWRFGREPGLESPRIVRVNSA